MRIHIIKVLKYTNSILARFSSSPFLPPSLLSSSSAQNPSECARSSGTIESEEWIVAVVSAALSYPAAVLLPSNLADAAKSKTFQTTPPPPPPHVGARSGIGRDRRECRKEQRGTLFIVGRTKEEEGLFKEGGSEGGTKCFRIA